MIHYKLVDNYVLLWLRAVQTCLALICEFCTKTLKLSFANTYYKFVWKGICEFAKNGTMYKDMEWISADRIPENRNYNN